MNQLGRNGREAVVKRGTLGVTTGVLFRSPGGHHRKGSTTASGGTVRHTARVTGDVDLGLPSRAEGPWREIARPSFLQPFEDVQMTEGQFVDALREKFSKDSHVVIPQVRNGTGFSSTVRTADAIVVSLWPSMGLYAHGWEFKDSRRDWLKEMKQPEKSNEIGRFCARWTLLTSEKDVARPEEIPDAWGLSYVEDGRIVDAKKAPSRETIQPTWSFVASVLRAAKDCVTDERDVKSRVARAVSDARKLTESTIRVLFDEKVRRLEERRDELQRQIQEFEQASGIPMLWKEDVAKIGAAVKCVLNGGADGVKKRLGQIADDLEHVMNMARKISQE